MVLDSNIMQDVIRISMDIPFLVNVSHASNMRETRLARRKGRNGITISVDDESKRKSLIKLSSDPMLEGARLTERVEDKIIS